MSNRKKDVQIVEEFTPVAGALMQALDVAVRGSVERLEAHRTAHGRSKGPGLYTRDGAADYLGVSKSTLDDYRRQDLLKAVHLPGGALRFSRTELDKFIRTLGE